MNILILMAGEGRRFSDIGYKVPKPLIQINGKTILEWTTSSCPFIKHYIDNQSNNVKLFFAVRKEHNDDGLTEFLHNVYGNDITIIPFEKTTKGNLDTARIASEYISDNNDDLLILDADNKYDDNNIEKFLKDLPKNSSTMAIFCFDPIETNLPNKWSNARVNNGIALEIKEKDDTWINYPCLIGIFYFSKVHQFKNYADYILENSNPVGFSDKKEYYMSMIPTHHANIGQNVYVHKVTNVIPLGTPEDLTKFIK